MNGTVARPKAWPQRAWKRFRREKSIWIICVPMIVWAVLFNYLPMGGLVLAFKNYKPGKDFLDCAWVGLRWFREFLSSPDCAQVLRNTIIISSLGIVTGFPAPILLAVLFKELQSMRFRKLTQTVSYLPHFISWVVTASIVSSILSSEGLINEILIALGFTESAINFLGTGPYFWAIITVSNLWKGTGWSTIIYLSAMESVDSELYEAGAMDGLSRTGMIWHVTLPGIRTTIAVLWIMCLAGILNAGFEQQLLLGKDITRNYWDVIDTYVYRYGIQNYRYSYGIAVGMLKSFISLALFFVFNRVSKRYLDAGVL